MATPIISLTPVIFLENQEDAAVSAAVLRVSIKLGDDGRCSAELEINNWGSQNGVTGYLFFQDERFARGKALKINAGSLTLFDGLITSVKARYPQGGAHNRADSDDQAGVQQLKYYPDGVGTAIDRV